MTLRDNPNILEAFRTGKISIRVFRHGPDDPMLLAWHVEQEKDDRVVGIPCTWIGDLMDALLTVKDKLAKRGIPTRESD